ncbi:hypothetical protein Hanom_Chr04g00338391 [Helianthus anomalus]
MSMQDKHTDIKKFLFVILVSSRCFSKKDLRNLFCLCSADHRHCHLQTVCFSEDVLLKNVCVSSSWCRLGPATSKIIQGQGYPSPSPPPPPHITVHHHPPPSITTTITHHHLPPPPTTTVHTPPIVYFKTLSYCMHQFWVESLSILNSKQSIEE